MYAKRITLLIAGLFLLLPGCDVDPTAVPTTVNGTTISAAQSAEAPNITELTATPDSSGNVILRIKATDPANSLLTFAWKVDQGQLSATTGPSVLWRPPSGAGTYTASVDVSNSKGLKRTATQQVTVNASGQASASQPAVVSAPVLVSAGGTTSGTGTTVNGGTGTTGTNATGQFQLPQGGQLQVPSPVPTGASSGLFVTPNPTAVTPTPAAPASPFTQPVATPVPGASSVASPVPQPIATPTPTPPPPSPVVLPTPTARPATPAPGVRTPPDSKWTQVDPLNLPAAARSENFNALHFIDDGSGNFNTGFAVGTSGAVMKTTNSGANWVMANTNIPSNVICNRVFFANANVGFIAGSQGKVFRTTDGGTTWADISPTFNQSNGTEFTALSVMNQAIIVVSTNDGKVFRSENADAAAAATVRYDVVTIDTKPAARPGDICGNLLSSDAFATAGDATTSWHSGSDGVFRADSDGAPNWTRFLTLGGTDGRGRATHMSSPNNLWVGSDTGILFRSLNAAGGTPTFEKFSTYRNREFGNGPTFLRVSGILDICFVGDNFGWMSTDDGHVYDTQNATNVVAANPVTWREMTIGRVLTDIQIQSKATTDAGGNPTIAFFGWGVGNGGAVYRYLPQ